MHKIGVLSDTHGLLRDEVVDILKDCEAVIHSGDIDEPNVLNKLKEIAPVYAVKGNADKGAWAHNLPYTLSFLLFDIPLFIVHNKKQLTEDLSDQKVIIYGHTHKYHEEYKNGRLWLNPGCCGHRKPGQPITLAIIEISDNSDITSKRIELAPTTDSRTKQSGQNSLPGNIDTILKKAIKMIKSAQSVEEIAEKCRISNDLSEMICRMYLTHPGIDLDGMIRRLEERM